MLVYAIVFVLLFLFYLLLKPVEKVVCEQNSVLEVNRVTNRPYLFFSCILFLLLLGLRGVHVGSDTIQYYYHYTVDEITGFNMSSLNLEIGFQFFEVICRKAGMSWQSFLFLQSLFIIISLGVFINKFSANPYLSTLLYFTCGMFSINISGGRQSLAIAIIQIGLCCLYDKKYFWFFISVAIAFLFHYSAVVCLVFFFLSKLNFRNDRQLLFWLFLPLIARFWGDDVLLPIFNYLPGRYLAYYEDEIHQMSLIREVSIFVVLFFCYFGLMVKKKDITTFDYQMFACLGLFAACEELSFSVYMAARLSLYFKIAYIILIPSVLKKYHNMRPILTTFIVFLFIVAFFVIAKDTPYENYYFF